MFRKSLLVFLLVSLYPACDRNIGTVGSIRITEQDVSQRAKVSEIYYPASGKPYVGLAQLIKGYLSVEVLKSMNTVVDNAVLETEATRIDENTKAPEMLRKIKDVYGSDRKAYLKTFVQMVYAERTLYNDVFLKACDIHREQKQKADAFLKAVAATPESFQNLARTSELSFATLKLSHKDGISPYGKTLEIKERGHGIDQADRMISYIVNLKAGAVYPQVVEWPESYQVLRFRKKERGAFIVESVSVPKRAYDDWFWEQASKIRVRIKDASLEKELLKEVSWAKNLRLE